MPGYGFGANSLHTGHQEISTFFGCILWKVSSEIGHDTRLIIDKNKASLEFGEELYRGRTTVETPHKYVVIRNLDPDPDDPDDDPDFSFKIFYNPDKTVFTIEDETESHVMLRYRWSYEYCCIGRLPKPGEILLGG